MANNRAQRLAKPFMSLVIISGALASLFAAYHLPISILDLRYLFLVAATLVFGSRIVVQIPRVKGQVSVSDTFILLTILLFDGEAAILLAAADAFCSSLRIAKKKFTVLFNTGTFVCSTFATAAVLRLCFGHIPSLSQGSYTSTFIVVLCVMAIVQYVVNSTLVAVGVALKAGKPVWQTWRQHFLWTSITYFAGASAAGIIAKLVAVLGLYAFLATVPIIAIVYFTYCTYLKNIEASTAHAEEAQRHADEAQRHVEALQQSEERFRSAFDNATIGMALVSVDGRWLQVNRSLCEIVGFLEQELVGSKFHDITHPEHIPTVTQNIEQLLSGRLTSYQTEKRYIHQLGYLVWTLLGVSVVRDSQGNPLHLIFQIQDITDRKRAEEQLLHDAFHDALTGLPNRALFMDHLQMAIQRSKRSQDRLFAALFLDLDRFKVINDSLGHMVGDQLLVGIARRLESCLRPGDTVARLGGDEFTVLLEDMTETNDAIEVAQRIQTELSAPFTLEGHEVFTTVSMGIAPSSIGYERAEDLLRDADTAMYRAKSSGKNRHEIFDKEMHDHAVNLMQLETDLRRAVEREEFFVVYQPLVSLETGVIRGFEALVRWQHPERGVIPPNDFISIAEETGLIIPIGQWVIREACRQVRRWKDRLGDDAPLTVSVNLSSKQFSQPDLIQHISRALDETRIGPGSLKLEITESMVMENVATAIEMLTEIRSLGVELSIDDFGTGYSSLSYLHRFPINTLKIDRSFVSRMIESAENAEIVRTIVTLAKSLQMDVVAEGVETEGQIERLKALKCEYAQGYFFGKPVRADAAFEVLTATHTQGTTTFAFAHSDDWRRRTIAA